MNNPFEVIDARLSNIETMLLNLKQEPNPITTTPQSDEILRIEQASKLLNLSKSTIYGYVRKSEIPVSKKGKHLYFSKNDLLQWVKEGKRKSLAEISAQAELYVSSNRKGGNRG